MRMTPSGDTLFFGDNLAILRQHVEDASVDLIYLDPPFNSNANYNVLFKSPTGDQSQAQIEAFDDTWRWTEAAERAFDEVMHSGHSDAAEMLRAMRAMLKENDMMAYLAMMAVRLIELHRVLKPTGSLYLHCDPTASHYLKILLDAVFGVERHTNEIIWRRSVTKGDARRKFSEDHDIILFYTKSHDYTFRSIHASGDEEYFMRFNYDDLDGRGRYHLAPLDSPNPRPNLTYPYKGYHPPPKGWRVSFDEMVRLDEEGRIWFPKSKDGRLRRKLFLSEQLGPKVGNVWTDIGPLQGAGKEKLGYPTQKPVALLERIIAASSNEGDLVLDPFCGCGTTIHAAEKLNRRWIGIDITHLAIGLIRSRLRNAFPAAEFEVLGVPKDAGGARELAAQDKHQFQLWALSMVEAQPFKGGRKGADGGVDGYVWFKPDGRSTEKAVVSVKGGDKVDVTMIKDLIATVERERAKVGVFLTLAPPTKPMVTEAAAAGLYAPPLHAKVPHIQILTIDDLFRGHRPDIPFIDASVFRKAKREADRQIGMEF